MQSLYPKMHALNSQVILRHIQAEGGPRDFKLAVFSSLPSTNQYLLEQADCEIRACLAESQSAGRGRQGRIWLSPPGGLYLSLQYPLRAAPPGALSPAVAVTLAQCLEEYGAREIGLKWPNDLLWRGGKLAGILLEARLDANGTGKLVIGIGLNVKLPARAAAPTEQAWVDLQRVMPHSVPERSILAGKLLGRLLRLLEKIEAEGAGDFPHLWKRFDILKGKELKVSASGEEVYGTARGIAADGALLLQSAEGPRHFYAGEAHVRPLSLQEMEGPVAAAENAGLME